MEKIVLSASSIGDKEMKEFIKDGKLSAFKGNPKTISPVIKSNAGNVINLETITVGERVAMAGNQVSNMKYGGTDYGKFIFTNKKNNPIPSILMSIVMIHLSFVVLHQIQ